jgi:hypothetical protein
LRFCHRPGEHCKPQRRRPSRSYAGWISGPHSDDFWPSGTHPPLGQGGAAPGGWGAQGLSAGFRCLRASERGPILACSDRGRVRDGKYDSDRRSLDAARCRGRSDGLLNYMQDRSTASEVSREEPSFTFRRAACGYPLGPLALRNDSMRAVVSRAAMLRDPLRAHLADVSRCCSPSAVTYNPPDRSCDYGHKDKDAVNGRLCGGYKLLHTSRYCPTQRRRRVAPAWTTPPTQNWVVCAADAPHDVTPRALRDYSMIELQSNPAIWNRDPPSVP